MKHKLKGVEAVIYLVGERKRNKVKCGCIFRRLKTQMAAIVLSVQNVAKLLRQKNRKHR